MKKNILIVSIILVFIGINVAWHNSRQAIFITIADKERITTGYGENVTGKYLVYTENEVFENTDSYLFLKFNSADLQGRLNPGQQYHVIVAGWRIPFLSMYRNIISVK